MKKNEADEKELAVCTIRMPRSLRQKIKSACALKGISVNQFILESIQSGAAKSLNLDTAKFY